MYLTLDYVEFENFMGGTLRHEFGRETNVYADNGKGKTRLKDCYSYVTTGRNSANEAKFHIKDTINLEKNKLPHIMKVGLSKANGEKFDLQKTLTEVWSPIQGSAEKRLTGNTIEYKINGDVKTKGDYEDLVNALIPTGLFKMLSDPLYFPEQMEWEEQRAVLAQMATEVTDEYVLNRIATPEKDYAPIIAILNQKSDLEKRKDRLSYEIGQLKKSHTPIMPKIEENTKQLTEIGKIDVKKIQKEIDKLQLEVDALDIKINSKADEENTQAEQTRGKRKRFNELKTKQDDIETEITSAYRADVRMQVTAREVIENEVSNLGVQIQSKTKLVETLTNKKEDLQKQQTQIESDWHLENAKDFPVWDETNFKCDKCNRAHETTDIAATTQKLKDDFIEAKKEALLKLNQRWESLEKDKGENDTLTATVSEALTKLKTEETAAKTKLNELVEKLAAQTAIPTVNERLGVHPEYIANKKELSTIEAELTQVLPVDYGQLKVEKSEIVSKIDLQKKELSKQDQIDYLTKRNETLAAEEKQLAEQIAGYQREDLLIDEFVIAKSKFIEETVRSKFEHVEFKMFRNNIGDPIPKPACEIWYQGKPWKALNTGSKVNAGLDIVNALSTHYGIFPPLLLDNRESTTRIINTKSQIINFFVSKDDQELRFEDILK